MLRDTPTDPRTPNLYRAWSSAAIEMHTRSLRGPCPISTSSCTNPPFFLACHALCTRGTLSSRTMDWSPGPHEIFDAAMAALPLDNLVTLTAQNRTRLDEQFWLSTRRGGPCSSACVWRPLQRVDSERCCWKTMVGARARCSRR
jgi:hypothetical protein